MNRLSCIDLNPFSDRISVIMNTFTAVIKKSDEWWIGWIEELPGVNSQGKTREELRDNLSSALREAIDMYREDAIAAAGGEFQEEILSV